MLGLVNNLIKCIYTLVGIEPARKRHDCVCHISCGVVVTMVIITMMDTMVMTLMMVIIVMMIMLMMMML